MLNPGRYIAVADLCAEDGSFDGEGFNVHLEFDVEILSDNLRAQGFDNIKHQAFRKRMKKV